MTLRNVVHAAGSAFAGGITGLVTGCIGTLVYIATRYKLKLPNSAPSIEVSLNATDFNINTLIKCYESHTSNCPLPINIRTDISCLTNPMVAGPAVGASIGICVGLGLYLNSRRKAQQQQKEEEDPLFGSSVEPSRFCC